MRCVRPRAGAVSEAGKGVGRVGGEALWACGGRVPTRRGPGFRGVGGDGARGGWAGVERPWVARSASHVEQSDLVGGRSTPTREPAAFR